jgi:hypothetical protein
LAGNESRLTGGAIDAGGIRHAGIDRVSETMGFRLWIASYRLQTVIGRRRGRWADLRPRAALWMHEASPEAGLCWRELVAQALTDGWVGAGAADRLAMAFAGLRRPPAS